MKKLVYYIIYKPYQVLTQFTSVDDKKCLKDFFKVEHDVYAVGRLDYDSEGLLILTNDTSLNNTLLNPTHEHKKTYWVQVEGAITKQKIQQLQQGVSINVDGKLYKTKPCVVNLFDVEPNVGERLPPIRVRQNIPTSWISITITEGKNRQIRKMTAAVGHPTLRLIRNSIEDISLQNMKAGDMIKISANAIKQKLNF